MKSPCCSHYLCEKVFVVASFLYFLYNISKFQILAGLASSAKHCKEWVQVLLCSNTVVPLRGVVLLKIPFWGDTCAECIQRSFPSHYLMSMQQN